MQALFEAAKEIVQEIGQKSRETEVYKEECLKLARYVSKVTLVLAELELQLHADESLHGSEAMFIAVEAILSSLSQALELVKQCSSTAKGRIWPLEDAVEFQSVALEMLDATEKVEKAQLPLPKDLQEDIKHFTRQLQILEFTEAELKESAVEELITLQKENKKATEEHVEVSTPSGAMSNIKPFRAAATSAATSAPTSGDVVIKPLDDTWEEIEHEEEEEEEEEETLEDGEGVGDEEETLELEKEGDVSLSGIPPPDEKLVKMLDTQGVAYVNRCDNSSETALAPDAPVKGAVENGKAAADLPSDPFNQD